MGRIESWSRMLRSSGPLTKVFMAISITSALVLCHRLIYAPYVRRERYRRAEEWADWIIQQEEMSEQKGIENTNNISY